MRPACFVDRDGVIVEEVGYLADPDDLVLIPGSGEAIRRLNEAGIPVVVVTNQSGVARGLFAESVVAAAHARLDALLQPFSARIDRYEYCPHHPTEGTGEYTVRCDCRKPAPGMLRRAAEALGVDLGRSWSIGDKASDLEAGRRAGCRTILVRTGYGGGCDAAALAAAGGAPDHVAEDLLRAVDHLLVRGGGAGRA